MIASPHFAFQFPRSLQRDLEIVRQITRLLIHSHLRPMIIEADQKIQEDPAYLPTDILQILNKTGLFSLWIPKMFGGRGFHPASMIAFNEEMGSACLGVANIVGAHYVGLGLISSTMNFKILSEITKKIREGEVSGQACLLTAAVTESTAGTDLEDATLLKRAKVFCKASKVDGGYRLDGNKIYISNAPWASFHVVAAYEDLAKPAESSVIAVVAKENPGVSVGAAEKKMGQHACPAAEVFLKDCFVDDAWICLEQRQFPKLSDFHTFSEQLVDDLVSQTRGGVGALATGSAYQSFFAAMRWLQKTPGLSQKQTRQFEVAKLWSNAKQAQVISWEAQMAFFYHGSLKDMSSGFMLWFARRIPARLQKFLGRGLQSKSAILKMRLRKLKNFDVEMASDLAATGSLAKQQCSRLAMENARIALFLMGSADSSLEKNHRDAKLLEIFEGTNEINGLNIFQHQAGRYIQGFRAFEETLR